MKAECVGIFPAENPVCAGLGVNVMAAFACSGPARSAVIRCYGSDGTAWQELCAKRCDLPENGHVHLYFTLEPGCFAPEKWGGKPCEEISVWFGEQPPVKGENSVLLYFQ